MSRIAAFVSAMPARATAPPSRLVSAIVSADAGVRSGHDGGAQVGCRGIMPATMSTAAERRRISDDELALWIGFIRVSQLLPAVLDSSLRAIGSSLPRYELLAVLARFPAGLRMSELGDLALVSKPRMTVHVAELVDEKLAARSPDPADARATIVTLTAAGKRHLARQTPEHLAQARALVLDHVATIGPELTAALDQMRRALGDPLSPQGAMPEAPSRPRRPRR